MQADKIKEEIQQLSFEEIIDIADYIDQTLESLWLNDLSISPHEKEVLANRLERTKNNVNNRYTSAELSEHLEAIKEQKAIEKELNIQLSDAEKEELDRRMKRLKTGQVERIAFDKAFNDLSAWANTK
ncbi:MAG: hypothetical protein AAGI49_04845 [Bacteroidota bacterium]